MTLQEHYNSIVGGKGNKAQFLKQARHLFPQHITNLLDFDTTVNVLKSKQIISENTIGGVVSKGFNIVDWKKVLAEETKAVEKNVSKEVEDYRKNAYNNADMKNADNVNFNEIMKGFYLELKNPKNHDKTVDELKDIVVKNLAKDALHYTKDGMFGVEGVGFTDEAPSLKQPVEPKGKHKSSGYGDLDVDVEKVKANVKDTLSNSEAKTSMPKKVKEMPDKGVKGVEKRIKLKEGISQERYEKELENTVSKYVKDPDDINKEMENYYEKGYQGFSDALKANLKRDMDFQTLVQMKHDEETLRREQGLEENEALYQQLADLQDELMSETDPERKKEIEAKIKALETGLRESKVRSLIAKLIKEELK